MKTIKTICNLSNELNGVRCAAVGSAVLALVFAWAGTMSGQVLTNPPQPQLKAITAGDSHSLALKTDGSLWSWGLNGYGELGLGTNVPSTNIPTRVGTDNDWATVSAGGSWHEGRGGYGSHTLALKVDGSLWAWGYTGAGEFGVANDVLSTNVPVRVGTDSSWTAIAAGVGYSLALKLDGSLWAWGGGAWGAALGLGPGIYRTNIPVRVGADDNWVAISAGGVTCNEFCSGPHALALKADGSLWAWGQNGYYWSGSRIGRLGVGTNVLSTNVPVRVGTDNDWTFVTAGIYSTMALKSDGSLWACGAFDLGRFSYTFFRGIIFDFLGDGTSDGSTVPKRIETNTDWTALSMGGEKLGLKRDGSLWALPGELGGPTPYIFNRVGMDNDWGYPPGLTEPGPFRIWRVTSGPGGDRQLFFSHGAPASYAVLDRGTTVTAITTPVALVFTAGWGVFKDSVPLTPSGTVFYRVRQVPILAPLDLDGDGIDDVYELRHARFVNPLNSADAAQDFDRDGRSNLEEYLAGTNPARSPGTALAAVGGGSLVLKTNGTRWTMALWDTNSTPLRAGDSSNWVSVFLQADSEWSDLRASYGHTLAIRPDGSLWAWGLNESGQLGIGTNDVSTDVPVRVGTNTDWTAVAAGAAFSVAIQRDGSLWTWGANGIGELGIGTPSEGTNIPSRVGIDRDWVAVDAGKWDTFEDYALALKADGSLWAWGANTGGELGLGGTDATAIPTRIGTDSNWRRFSAGSLHAVAVKADGSLWTWGGGFSGGPPIPTRIGTDTNWLAASAGVDMSLALKTDGTLWRWAVGEVPRQIGTDTDWGSPP